MKKKTIKEKIKELPTLDNIIEDSLKDSEVLAEYQRAQIRIAVARAIKTAREKADFTQEDLAKALGIPQPQIGRLESLKNKSLPGLDLLAKIAKVTKRKLVINQSGLHLELAVK